MQQFILSYKMMASYCIIPMVINPHQWSQLNVKEDLLCSVCDLPIPKARQCVDCGCRICEECYTMMKIKDQTTFDCKRCKLSVNLKKVFVDRAVTNEIKRTSFPCYHEGCLWKGSSSSYKDHISNCKFAIIKCPNTGCKETFQKQKLKEHTSSCSYRPITCKWCKNEIPSALKDLHEMNECLEVKIPCPVGCEVNVCRKMVHDHIENKCKLKKHSCLYKRYGCTFEGNRDQLEKHESCDTWKHVELLEKAISLKRSEKSNEIDKKIQELNLQVVRTNREMHDLKREVDNKLLHLSSEFIKMERTFRNIQEDFQEVALTTQILQATSYNGEFVWKVPEVTRRRDESITGKTVSLYSAPFYTSRFGYKLCLRLYMNGDGSGKGTHLSLFLSIMKGDYDALLEWPFRCRVSLMLLDQKDGRDHISDYFQPDPTSSSFWRPQSDMNIASGCPRFAPLSVLHNPKYVVDDTIFFKAVIDSQLAK